MYTNVPSRAYTAVRDMIGHIFVPGITDAVRVSRGSRVSTSLHNGMTPQQIIDANPIVYFDLRGVIDAAQHELCPDTLH
jgi:hypothetical protein